MKIEPPTSIVNPNTYAPLFASCLILGWPSIYGQWTNTKFATKLALQENFNESTKLAKSVFIRVNPVKNISPLSAVKYRLEHLKISFFVFVSCF
jgi:hypothetical protein